MNETWKKRWCDALESGEYPQATGALRTKDGFCCLGVLESLVLKDAGQEWIEDNAGFAVQDKNGIESAELRDSTGQLVELDPGNLNNPELRGPVVRGVLSPERMAELHYQPGYGSFSLAGLNDDGATFAEISAIIRAAL